MSSKIPIQMPLPSSVLWKKQEKFFSVILSPKLNQQIRRMCSLWTIRCWSEARTIIVVIDGLKEGRVQEREATQEGVEEAGTMGGPPSFLAESKGQ